MPYQVQVGAQVVEFPDSVSQNEAQRILADQFPATGEDIAGAMQDPAFKPTQEDYLKYEEYAKNKQTDWVNTAAQAADAAVGMITGAAVEGVKGAALNPANYLEGFAQGTRQLYGLVAQSQDPSSPLFKFKDLIAGTGTPESRYQQFLEARDFANTTARLERGEEGLAVPPEYTNPEYVQGVSMILDPTLFVPGVGEILGTGKLATRAVGKGTQLTGRAIAGVARPLERVAGAAERMTAEALGMTPEGLRSTAATAGIAGALGIAPEAATLAAIPAGIRTAREAGEALARAGENLMTQPSRIGPLEAIGAAPGANMRQRMLGVIGQYGGDAALDAALRATAGGLEGAAVGTGLGYLSGGEEGAAAGLGAGGVQGAAGALGGRAYQKLTGQAAKEARAGDLGRFIDAQQDPTTKALFERVRDTHGVDAASALMDLGALVKGTLGDIDINYLSDADFVEKYKGRSRGAQIEVGDRPVLDINADFIGRGQGDTPLYTLGHELFHALEKSKQLSGAATEIKDALVGRWIQEGDTIRKLAEGALTDSDIEARFNQYRDKLAVGNPKAAADLAQYDTISKKADYIASEVAAEHFARLLAGQKPDALLKGFSGLTRQLMDAALTQNAIKSIANAAASIERTFGIKPTDSVLFPDLKQASPQLNAMLRDLVRARRRLDEKILLDSDQGGRVLKPEDVGNPLAARELVDMGVAEQMPDGSIRNLSNEEIRARDDRDMKSLRSITENIPGAAMVDGAILGRFSPQQLSAIEQSQAISSRMKDKIRGVNAAMQAGNSIHVVYSAALKRAFNRITKKYSPRYDSGIRVSEREVMPYAFYLSKADNPLVKVIDITKVRNALTKELAKDGSIGGLWSNVDGFMSDLAKYFTNLDQKEGARRSYEIFGDAKARFLGDFVNAQEKGGRKFVRDLRLDRIGAMSPMDFRARISEDAIQLSKDRWMPAEKIGDKDVLNSENGYRIISGAKHKLYGPDGKLLGIYDTQTQAERKADATQARLQPEVRQQQYPARDEVRQTAEAGGGNRALDGTQGGQEGRQVDRTVRQAGDVRFMPASPETPEFKQWFGASKVSTPDGKPLVVYHGTNVPLTTFKTNRPAWFAENPELANQFTAGGRRSMGSKPGKGSSVLPVYLRIENPLDLTSMNPGTKISRVELLNMIGADSSDAALRDLAKQQIESKFVGLASTIADPIQYMVNLYKEKTMLYQLLDDPNMVSSIKNAGFDGVSMTENVTVGKKNAPQKVDSITYAVFDPNQVKSATGNVGTFSTTNPDIRYMPSDADYLSAVKAGDTAKAQQMVDEAAKKAGKDSINISRGSSGFRETAKMVDELPDDSVISVFTATNPRTADKFITDGVIESEKAYNTTGSFEPGRGLDRGIYVGDSPLAVEGYGRVILKIAIPKRRIGISTEAQRLGYNTVGLALGNQSNGAVIAGDIPPELIAKWEGDRYNRDPISVSYPAITRDNSGNVIPLSQRFQQSSADIRYMPTPDASMPGAYSFQGGFRALPGNDKGKLRVYAPGGALIGIAANLDQAQQMIQKKAKQ